MYINILVVFLIFICMIFYTCSIKISLFKRVLGVFIVCYLLTLLNITLFGRQVMQEKHIVLQLFHSYCEIWRQDWDYAGKYIMITTIGNIFIFMPLGIGLMNFKRLHMEKREVILIGFLLSLVIEGTQWYTQLGTFEIDDMFHNTLGCYFGIQIYEVITSWKNKEGYKTIGKEIFPIVCYGLLFMGVCAVPWLEYINR